MFKQLVHGAGYSIEYIASRTPDQLLAITLTDDDMPDGEGQRKQGASLSVPGLTVQENTARFCEIVAAHSEATGQRSFNLLEVGAKLADK